VIKMPKPLNLSFENLTEKYNAKVVNPVSFEHVDEDGYPIWSFKLNNDIGLISGADYILISRLELIRMINSAVQGLKKDIRRWCSNKFNYMWHFKKLNTTKEYDELVELIKKWLLTW